MFLENMAPSLTAATTFLGGNWEPAHSVVEDASLWGGDCPLPSGSGWHVPASLPLAGGGACTQPASSLLVLTQSFVL